MYLFRMSKHCKVDTLSLTWRRGKKYHTMNSANKTCFLSLLKIVHILNSIFSGSSENRKRWEYETAAGAHFFWHLPRPRLEALPKERRSPWSPWSIFLHLLKEVLYTSLYNFIGFNRCFIFLSPFLFFLSSLYKCLCFPECVWSEILMRLREFALSRWGRKQMFPCGEISIFLVNKIALWWDTKFPCNEISNFLGTKFPIFCVPPLKFNISCEKYNSLLFRSGTKNKWLLEVQGVIF